MSIPVGGGGGGSGALGLGSGGGSLLRRCDRIAELVEACERTELLEDEAGTCVKPSPVGEMGESLDCVVAEVDREGDEYMAGAGPALLERLGEVAISAEDAPLLIAVVMDGVCAPTASDSGRRGLNSSQGRVSSGEAGT